MGPTVHDILYISYLKFLLQYISHLYYRGYSVYSVGQVPSLHGRDLVNCLFDQRPYIREH